MATEEYEVHHIIKSENETFLIHISKMVTEEYKVHNIVKSENDKREYKYLILKNKLRLLLISDQTAEKSAASVCVNVGHSSDPVAVPGIAHVCEHMLSLGTEKYPVEDEFEEFLLQNLGNSEANVSDEYTNYSFNVISDALYPALDRFAQFFISPLFNSDLIKGELDKIDSDLQENYSDDSFVMNYIGCMTSKPDHVYQRLGSVDLDTLKKALEEKNIDIRQLLLDFHTKFYSANITTVCILGRDTIEEIEKFAVPLFGQIMNKDVIVPECKEFPYGEEETEIIIKVATISEMEKIELTFTIPDYVDNYSSKPCHYLSHLINQKGKGSLLSMLSKKDWVESLCCKSYLGLKGFEFFSIVMELDKEGINHINEIVDDVFMYINMLRKNIELWVFNEMKMMHEINFRFEDKYQSKSYVNYLTRSMHFYEPKDVLYGPYKFEAFSPELIEEVLSYLKPSNLRIMIVSQTYKGNTDRTVKYTDVGFSLEKIPKERIEKLNQIGSYPKFHLPKKNIFIPESLDVVVDKAEKDVKSIPTMIKNNSMMRVWYKADDTFFTPKSCLKIHVSSPNARSTPLRFNLLKFFILLLNETLPRFLDVHGAELAGIEYNIAWTSFGFLISISGFSSEQLNFLKKILHHLSVFKKWVEIEDDDSEEAKNLFKEMKGDEYKKYLNDHFKNINVKDRLEYMELKESDLLTEFTFRNVVTEILWNIEEVIECIGDVTVSLFNAFITEFFQHIFIECLMCGNLLIEDVHEICGVIEEKLIKDKCSKPMLPTQHILYREHKLPKASNYLYEKRFKHRTSSCIQVYYQVGVQKERLNVLCQLFEEMIEDPFYQMMSTTEQLGWNVSSGIMSSHSVQGIFAFIESDKPPNVVEEKIESFFEQYEETLNEMSDEQFNNYVDALVEKKLDDGKPKSIQQETDLYWSEILLKRYHFRRHLAEVESLKKITKDDVMKFFKTYIAPSSNGRKKLVVATLGKDAKAISEEKNSFQKIANLFHFKWSLPLYPHMAPYSDIQLPV